MLIADLDFLESVVTKDADIFHAKKSSLNMNLSEGETLREEFRERLVIEV